jgi:hypothetical protein
VTRLVTADSACFYRWVSIAEQTATIAVAASGIVGAVWAAAKWLRRPRFICGIPPLLSEREAKGIDRKRLGVDSVATAFRHRPDCFAQPFRNPNRPSLSPDAERRFLDDAMRCRSIQPDERGHTRVPVLIANRGKRIANYTATITFYSRGGKVHVTDVTTETLPVYLYAERPELAQAVLKLADMRIVTAYGEYLMDKSMTHWGDVVALANGHLEASLFELVVIEVEIEVDVDSFFVLYTLDCADGWTGAKTFIQGCRITRERVPAT